MSVLNRRGITAFLLSALITIPLTAQDDPLAGERQLVQSEELVLFQSSTQTAGLKASIHEFVSYGNPDIPDSISVRDSAIGDFDIGGDHASAMVVADFNDDGMDQVLTIWEDGSRGLRYAMPEMESADIRWGSIVDQPLLPGGSLVEDPQTFRQIRAEAGNFDDDPELELALAYWAASGEVILSVYEVGTGLTEISSAPITTLQRQSENELSSAKNSHFDITVGNLDDSGPDDVALSYAQPVDCPDPDDNPRCWAVSAMAISVEGQPSVMSEVVVDDQLSRDSEVVARVGIQAIDFLDDGTDDLVVVHEREEQSDARWFMQLVEASGGVLSVDRGARDQFHQSNGNSGYPLSMAGRDLNRDGPEELIVYFRQLYVFTADSLLNLRRDGSASPGSRPEDRSDGTLAIGDLDGGSAIWRAEPDKKLEIAVTRTSKKSGNPSQAWAEIFAYRYTPGFGLTETLAWRDESEDQNRNPILHLAAGNFGDRGVRLGPPSFHRRTDIVQPLVVLNAPPTHFDAFDGTSLDVNGCYNGQDCGAFSFYEKRNSTTVEVTSEVKGDWQLGAGISGGLNEILDEVPVVGDVVGGLLDALGVGIDFSVEAEYGEGFRNRLGRKETVRVEQEVSTLRDDVIYATVMDYDIWEYPMWVRGKFAGNMAIVLPGFKQNAWFPVKSPTGTEYRAQHEPGNIMSYPAINDPQDNRRLRQNLLFEAGDRVVLGPQTQSWSVSTSSGTFSESQASTKFSLSGDVDISLPIPTVGVNLNGDYSESTINTHATKVKTLQGVSVNFAPISTSIEGQASFFAVTPYLYWDNTGALVLDYLVEPSVANVGEPETWWQTRYGKAADPALNLPWRNDHLKVDPATSELTRTRTKDISFFPLAAAPGENVSIRALIRNFSLLPTPGQVTVRFYAGDPDAGGTPIGDDVVVPIMAARGDAVATTEWTVPAGLRDSFVRVYAVVNPDGSMPEIHANNNKGWAPLGLGVPVSNELESPEVALPVLHANYPNPFSQSSTITYHLPEAADVRVVVYDMLGREAQVVADGREAAGTHFAVVDGGALAPGVYVYRLELEGVRLAGRMVVVR